MGLLKHGVIPMNWESLEVLSERTRDPAVSVKKKALQCVGELLAVSPNSKRTKFEQNNKKKHFLFS